MGNAPTKASYPRSVTGAGSTGKRVHWNGPGLPSPPGKPILIPGAEHTQPDLVSIRWERSRNNGGSAIVGYLVEHRRMGSPHWVRAAPILCTLPELTLSGLEPGWRYQFRVKAQNALGLSEPSELSDPLTVTLQRPVVTAPKFDLELKDTVALENEQAEFVVKFSGTPLPKISWFKDGFEIFSSRRTRIVTENGKSCLLIHQTALDDEGEIKCTATNRMGHISTKGKLILEAPPKIRLPRQYEDGLSFELGETIKLKVSLVGRPSPNVTWFRNGEPIVEDYVHILESMEGEGVLKIPVAKRTDRGEYTVKATNKLGEDSSSFLVTVTDRPSPPGKATVTMTLGRSVTLSWKEPEDDGGCKIGTYTVEYYRVGWDMWVKAAVCRQLTTTLGELIEGSEYRFRVKAENPYGVSNPSEESDSVFIPVPKRGVAEVPLRYKSQSQRDIDKTNRERREVSFAEPVHRTRSLAGEEASRSVQELSPEWKSPQQPSPGRPSRAKLKVDEPPVRPAKRLGKQESVDEFDVPKNHEGPGRREAPMTGNRRTTPFGSKLPFADPLLRSLSRERSLSPLPMPQIQESHEELLAATPYTDSSHLILQKQRTFDSLLPEKPANTLKKQNTFDSMPTSCNSAWDNNESMLHGSSEFMLVLYPEEEVQKTRGVQELDSGGNKGSPENVDSEEDAPVSPALALSLPDLFSASYEIVESLRLAASSTELLHKRAMERFYQASAIEEAELSKRKARAEKHTGELAGLCGNASQKGEVRIRINSVETIDSDGLERRSSLRRRLSNSGMSGQAVWQAKRDRRRMSEGQAPLTQLGLKTSLKLMQDASSDPNLTAAKDTGTANRIGDRTDGERLHRWDEKNMPLVLGVADMSEERYSDQDPPEEKHGFRQPRDDGVESVETSEESSEESSDSEDLKLLKARIMAQPIIDEEDTYHPRGRPVQHFNNIDPRPHLPYKLPPIDVNSNFPSRPFSLPSSPTSPMPKSILKKRTETETLPLNQFARSMPPEKPARRSLQAEDVTHKSMPGPTPFAQLPSYQPQTPRQTPVPQQIPVPRQTPVHQPFSLLSSLQQPQQTVTLRKRSLTNIPDAVKGAAISESDIDNSNVLSAAEIARNRRRQLRQVSLEEEAEANMAVISHYTEIVREHSVTQTTPTHYLKREDVARAAPQSGERSSTHDVKNSVIMPNGSNDLRIASSNARLVRSSKVDMDFADAKISSASKLEGKEIRKSVDRDEFYKARKSSVSQPREPMREGRSSSRNERRSSSRNERRSSSRNASRERRESRPPSRTEIRGTSQEKFIVEQRSRAASRSRNDESRDSRERSVEKRKSSRSSSRSNSRDRYRPETPTEVKMERLQQALASRKYRIQRQYSSSVAELTADAEKTVRSTMSYVTDLTLLTAAVYVYFFKSEVLAVPFIGLLLYRQIQQELRRRLPSWWKRHK